MIRTGVAASPGTGVGPALVHVVDLPPVESWPAGDPGQEPHRLAEALSQVAETLESLAADHAGEAGEILSMQSTMASDPELLERSSALVAGGLSPARAVAQAGEAYASTLAAGDNEYLAARAADVRDVCGRAVRVLLGLPPADLGGLLEPAVIVARDLTPSDTAGLDPAMVLGLATEEGSRTSHTAILARSLGVPAVVAVRGLLADVAPGELVAVDGGTGEVRLGDEARDALTATDAVRPAAAAAAAAAVVTSSGPAATSDGHRVELAANVSSVAELAAALEHGAEGVGLFRTELAYLGRTAAPTTADLEPELTAMVDLLAGRRLVVRTFDFGADKAVPFVADRPGPNPALGVRGIRLAREHPQLLEDQLAAVATAARRGPVAVMAPMVSTPEEAAWFVGQVRAATGPDAAIEVGVMVEVPSAVLLAAEIAVEVDFVSVGTNDLAQYLYAADRQEGALAALQDPYSPAMLRALDAVCRGAEAGGAWVGVCGEAASEPGWGVLAVGLGVAELSMSGRSIPAVRAALAAVTSAECRVAAAQALAATSPTEVRAAAALPGAR